MKFVPKRSAPKWTSNKMGNATKSHNKTDRAKVVAPKSRASKCIGISIATFHCNFAPGHLKYSGDYPKEYAKIYPKPQVA